jgi:predicted membrane chloride channel (bestrophin family)
VNAYGYNNLNDGYRMAALLDDSREGMMKRANKATIRHLCEVLEWAKGQRGRKDINPYMVPEIKEALKHLADLQGIKDYLDAITDTRR